MKTETEVENILRHAPRPQPAPPLVRSLKSRISLPAAANGAGLDLGASLWRRWFPALAYAVLILGCIVVLAVQTNQRQELIRQNEELREQIAVAEDAADTREQAHARSLSAGREIEQWKRDAAEADQLAERLTQLRAQIAELTTQAGALEAQLAAVPAQEKVIAPFDFFDPTSSPLSEAREKAAKIACVNNMKQIGLALRIHVNDHGERFPPDFNTVSNELGTAKTLCCPADRANQDFAAALFKAGGAGWAGWPKNGGSYEYRAAGLTFGEVSPDEVATKCRIHGFVGLMDGSVHQDPNYESKLREKLRSQP